MIQSYPATWSSYPEVNHHSPCWCCLERRWHLEWLGFFYASPPYGSVVDNVEISCYSSSPLQTELSAILKALELSHYHNITIAYIFTHRFSAIMQTAGMSESHCALFFVAQPQKENFQVLFVWSWRFKCIGLDRFETHQSSKTTQKACNKRPRTLTYT